MGELEGVARPAVAAALRGPRDLRRHHRFGLGTFEILDLAEAAGFEPIITTAGQNPNHAFPTPVGDEQPCCDPADMADL